MRLITLILTFTLVFTSSADDNKGASKAPFSSGNVVPGLKLPAPQTIDSEESFITIQAESTGTVKWLVLSTSVKLKTKIHRSTPNEIDIGIPKYQSVIVVYAVALVNGKFTEFARTDITVNGSPMPQPPEPTPPPKPTPDVVKLPLHFSVIEDPANRTPAIGKIITSVSLRTKFKPKQVLMRVYTTKDEEITAKKFNDALKTYGTPMFILQDGNGKGLLVDKLPATEEDVLRLIGPYVGGF